MGSGHSHSHGDADRSVSTSTRRLIGAVVAVLGVATLIAALVLWPRNVPVADTAAFGNPDGMYTATVLRQAQEACPTTFVDEGAEAVSILCTSLSLKFVDGPEAGETKALSITDSGVLPDFEAGERVSVSLHIPVSCREDSRGPDMTLTECLDGLDPNIFYAIESRDRAMPMIVLALLFAAIVIVLGRLRGLLSLVGLGASIAVLIVFVLPGILAGRDPLAVALVGGSVIAFLALYLAHGFNPLTHVALIGTLGSLAMVAALSNIFVGAAKLSGFTDESAVIVRAFGANISFSGLVLAGTIIGALGAIDDMTVTQAASVLELHRANASLGVRELYQRSLRIGRDHIASTVNTLVLAYAGGSLALLVMFTQMGRSQSTQTFGRVITSEVIATEVVKTLVGSIGLVASVPVTTWLAAIIVTRGATSGRHDHSATSDATPRSTPGSSMPGPMSEPMSASWPADQVGSPGPLSQLAGSTGFEDIAAIFADDPNDPDDLNGIDPGAGAPNDNDIVN